MGVCGDFWGDPRVWGVPRILGRGLEGLEGFWVWGSPLGFGGVPRIWGGFGIGGGMIGGGLGLPCPPFGVPCAHFRFPCPHFPVWGSLSPFWGSCPCFGVPCPNFGVPVPILGFPVPAELEVGKAQEFTVKAKGAGGQGKVGARILGPARKPVPCTVEPSAGGDSSAVRFVPRDEGPHSVEVTYDGVPVPGSPFPVEVVPPTDPSKVSAGGLGGVWGW